MPKDELVRLKHLVRPQFERASTRFEREPAKPEGIRVAKSGCSSAA